ncbi:MAG: UDP-glucose/GDP-mannose dehydrogenase family protein [Acidimicrobiales bacterium]|nr:UDP-glucose/GDP-mannose dehydrogenase family protein [Acidimicrobiales bacterium]
MARLAIIGTGYVGLTTGACLAHLGHDVVCADVDVEKVDRLVDGEVPIVEAGLSDLVAEGLSADRLRFTADVAGSVADRQVVFLCVPTPHAPDGSVDLSYVEAAAASIGASLAPGAVVVNKSTVPVGTTAVVSGIIGRDDVAVASNPEFLREGTAVADFLGPDRIVIGSDDDRAREVVRSIYDGVDAPMVLTDPASAETIKYAANAFLVTKLSFANAIAAVCEGVGADIDDVVLALGYDPRIGASHLRPGPGWGGSCFPKDSRALIHQAGQAGYDFRFLDSAIEVNRQQFDRIVDKVRRAVGGNLDGRAVAVWGLTFKAGTDDLRDSPALEIVDRILTAGASVRAHDPTVPIRRGPVPDDVVLADDPVEACAGADVLLVLTEWPEYAAVAPGDAVSAMVGRAVVDARNLLDPGPWRDLGVGFEGIGR